tara:strand:+ start:2989 stop:3618 length:630 start_codon:yes stop_codon:yes gene_type:complete
VKAKVIGYLIALVIRAIAFTLRISFDDRCGVSDKTNSEGSVIWVFWHCKVFLMPIVYKEYLLKRKGTVLTSPSRDGQIIVEVMKRFGVHSIRGSSNKSPVKALRESIDCLQEKNGGDLAVTPDGPRGPSRVMKLGAIKIAQMANVPIMPITISYSKFIELKTWDNFQIPLPFSRVSVVLHEFHWISKSFTKEEIGESALAIEKVLKSLP